MRKYKNDPVEYNGVKFDSKRESQRYAELKLLERAAKITGLQRQVKFELIPAQYETVERYSDKTGKRLKDGKRLLEKECSYIADFVYSVDGRLVVEDVKGYRDPQSAGYAKFVIKRKLMLYLHGIKIQEV